LQEQTVCIPPAGDELPGGVRRVRLEPAPESGLRGRGRDGKLALEKDQGHVTCNRGHEIRVLRALPASLVH
jgi:hypothetical protein